MRMRVFLITLAMRRLISPIDEAAFRRNRRRPQSTQIDADGAQIQAVELWRDLRQNLATW